MSTSSSKPWYTSLTIWSIVFAAVAGALNKWGYKVSDAFVSEGPKDILILIQTLGLAGAVVGRARTKKALTLTILLLAIMILPGCANPQVTAERTLTTSFDSVNTFLTIENQNRAIVDQKLPAVAKLSDNIRTNFPPAFKLAEDAVKNYEANPQTADALLNEVVALAQQAAAGLQQINGVSNVKYQPLKVPKHR